MSDCPHCHHQWDAHEVWDLRCAECGCMWQRPKPPAPPPPPRTLADTFYEAFWKAADILRAEDAYDIPYLDQEMDMIDTSGDGMPERFWTYMAQVYKR